MKKDQNYTASITPEEDIAKISYAGQPEHMRMYKSGFEMFFNQLPVIHSGEEYLDAKIRMTQSVMENISEGLRLRIWPFITPPANQFHRTIIGMESPKDGKEGAEVIVAKWGKGFSSPVHGHAAGYMHEEVLDGKLLVDTFRIVDEENKIVRPSERVIIGEGVFVSEFAEETPEIENKRRTLVHTFTALEETTSLHFVPEHTRDGRDNSFSVENFSDQHPLSGSDVERIDSRQGMYLQKGEVVLVRSTNVPEYGDHFIVIIGHPVVKEHGLRPQDRAYPASKVDSKFLDTFSLRMGLTLLKLKPEARDRFHAFHGITKDLDKIVFPSH